MQIAGATGQLSVCVGHVGGADLVTAGDEPDRGVVERVEHREVALAGHPVTPVDAVNDELVDEELAARSHRRLIGCSK